MGKDGKIQTWDTSIFRIGTHSNPDMKKIYISTGSDLKTHTKNPGELFG